MAAELEQRVEKQRSDLVNLVIRMDSIYSSRFRKLLDLALDDNMPKEICIKMLDEIDMTIEVVDAMDNVEGNAQVVSDCEKVCRELQAEYVAGLQKARGKEDGNSESAEEEEPIKTVPKRLRHRQPSSQGRTPITPPPPPASKSVGRSLPTRSTGKRVSFAAPKEKAEPPRPRATKSSRGRSRPAASRAKAVQGKKRARKAMVTEEQEESDDGKESDDGGKSDPEESSGGNGGNSDEGEGSPQSDDGSYNVKEILGAGEETNSGTEADEGEEQEEKAIRKPASGAMNDLATMFRGELLPAPGEMATFKSSGRCQQCREKKQQCTATVSNAESSIGRLLTCNQCKKGHRSCEFRSVDPYAPENLGWEAASSSALSEQTSIRMSIESLQKQLSEVQVTLNKLAMAQLGKKKVKRSRVESSDEEMEETPIPKKPRVTRK